MKKIKLGPSFAENIEQSARTSTLVNNEVLEDSISWGKKEVSFKTQPISVWRMVPLYLFFIVSFMVLAAKAFSLQVIQGSNFRSAAEGNHVRILTTHAARGAILDRNGKVLAQSKPGFSVVIDKQSLPKDHKEEFSRLSALLQIPIEEINKALNNADQNDFVLLKANIDHPTAIDLEAQTDKFPAVAVEITPVREYLEPDVLAPILGYTSEVNKDDLQKQKGYLAGDKVGRAGAEAAFEDRLRGANGYELLKVNAAGKKQGSLVKTEAAAGNDVSLSLDLDLQNYVYERAVEALKKSAGDSAAVVVTNPKTGEVLAMVSLPSYDDNLFAKGLTQSQFNDLFNNPSRPLINRAFGSAFSPGSTFKMVMSAAGLETGAVTKDTKLLDSGYLTLGTITFQNWLWRERGKTDGAINIIRAIARSNDLYFYRLGQKLGEKTIADYAHLFGLGEKTGIELPGETEGLIPTPEWKMATRGLPWYPGETLNISIGQGDVLVTPLQLAMVTGTIANGGNLLRPTFLPTSTPDVVRKNFLKKETLQTILAGMVGNQKGDGNVGYIFNNYPVSTAGKTGSAETGVDKKLHGWYTVFAPVENPQILVTCMVQNGNGHGGDIWGPEVKKIFDWWFANRKPN